MKKLAEAIKCPIEKVLMWALFVVAVTPAIYADNTITPAQTAKTLYLRFCIFIVSVLFAYLMISTEAFRGKVMARIQELWKQPIVKIMVVLYGILLVSTFFAHNHFYAFLGEPEREEGLLGLSFFYAFFVYAVILFKKKDWYTFFWVTLATQVATFGAALFQFSHGLHRTNSIMGNPIYFAVYGLTLMILAAMIWVGAKRNRESGARFLSGVLFFVGLIEIFLGNTRSVLLGVVVATPVALMYAVANTERLFPRIDKRRVQKTAGAIFLGLAVFAGIFLSTRHATIWTHVPGLDRIAASSVDDATTQSRIVSWSIALHSINPGEAGITRTLVGWGWDNYFFAWQKFYQSRLYQYDTATFDHPHNKLLDMLVMNGVLGFLAYMALWFFFLKAVVHYGKREPAIALLLIFWSVAYFIQNLFAFDTSVSWIATFALFGFIANESLYEHEQ